MSARGLGVCRAGVALGAAAVAVRGFGVLHVAVATGVDMSWRGWGGRPNGVCAVVGRGRTPAEGIESTMANRGACNAIV